MSQASARSTTAPSAKPLKRPSQARAKFTVQAIYDAFVRIWQRDGYSSITTRAVALETGIAVGTLYDYFPSKEALLSGYVRHSMEVLLHAIAQQAIEPVGLSWQQRIHQLVRLTCGVQAPELPWFHPDMLLLEARIAEPKHHRRVHEELSKAWLQVFAACDDLPQRPADDTVKALHLAVWGARRYGLLLALSKQEMARWAQQMEHLCRAVVQAPPGDGS
jgi:AcrR family transcriptional regulator